MRAAAPLALAVAAGVSAGQGTSPGPRSVPDAQARSILAGPAQMDPESRGVMERVSRAYGALKSLETITRGGPVEAIGRLKRPRLYHFLQKKKEGELVALAISDGKRYYEYTERTRNYIEREAAVLGRLTLPANVRLFFTGQQPGSVMVGLDGKPAVREYSFRYLGQERVAGKPAHVLRVSTLARGPSGAWSTFHSRRYFDAGTHLLRRIVNGARVLDVENRINPELPTAGFRWQPIPGATKGFG